jgi:hypothetical protein
VYTLAASNIIYNALKPSADYFNTLGLPEPLVSSGLSSLPVACARGLLQSPAAAGLRLRRHLPELSWKLVHCSIALSTVERCFAQIHWGHPANMAVVLAAMGIYGCG